MVLCGPKCPLETIDIDYIADTLTTVSGNRYTSPVNEHFLKYVETLHSRKQNSKNSIRIFFRLCLAIENNRENTL